MPAFPTGTSLTTDHLDNATDSPASARTEIKASVDAVADIIASYDSASGIAALDSSGKIVNTKLPNTLISSSSANLTLDPDTSMVKIQNFINLSPVAYANLPASPAQGDVAFLTTDGAAATKNQLVFYNGTNWYYVGDPATAVAAS